MRNNLAITTFNIDRYTTLESFLAEYEEIGMNTLELNGRVRRFVIDALLPSIEKGKIYITSLHIFCPKPEGVDDENLRLSDLDEAVRKSAVHYTLNTIDTAWELGAEAVVLHPGEVDGLRYLQDTLIDFYRNGRKDSSEYKALLNKLITQRKQEKKEYVRACERSLLEIVNYLDRKSIQIKLGLETPFYYNQLPSIEEYSTWFERYEDAPIYLWYDFGHWEVQANLGLVYKHELLRKHGKRLLGLHIHDCSGVKDHKVPGEGDIDFAFIKQHLRPDVLRVLEYGRVIRPLSRISQGIEYLKKIGIA